MNKKKVVACLLAATMTAGMLAGFIHISVWRLETTANERKLGLSAR